MLYIEMNKELRARYGRIVRSARADLRRNPLKSKKEENEFMFDRGFEFAVASLRTEEELKSAKKTV